MIIDLMRLFKDSTNAQKKLSNTNYKKKTMITMPKSDDWVNKQTRKQ